MNIITTTKTEWRGEVTAPSGETFSAVIYEGTVGLFASSEQISTPVFFFPRTAIAAVASLMTATEDEVARQVDHAAEEGNAREDARLAAKAMAREIFADDELVRQDISGHGEELLNAVNRHVVANLAHRNELAGGAR